MSFYVAALKAGNAVTLCIPESLHSAAGLPCVDDSWLKQPVP